MELKYLNKETFTTHYFLVKDERDRTEYTIKKEKKDWWMLHGNGHWNLIAKDHWLFKDANFEETYNRLLRELKLEKICKDE